MDYDSYTGQESTEIVQNRQDLVASEAQTDLVDFTSLAQHPGWRKILAAIKGDLDESLLNLLHSTTPDTIRIFQERAKARRDFLAWLEMKVAERDYQVDEQKAAGA